MAVDNRWIQSRTALRRPAAEQHGSESTPATILPAGGEPGPAALRSYRRFRTPAHRATSAVLSGAYPFLAEGGLGASGALIGEDLFSGGSFCFDPWALYADGVLTNPNVVLAGVIGVGKSALAKAMICRSIAFGRRAYVPGTRRGSGRLSRRRSAVRRSPWGTAYPTA